MTETGWQAIGRLAKARRERLGLNQDELAQYGGPRVSTVGKFERAAQDSFPLRTQHQIEKALGWTRGTVEQFVAAFDEGDLDMGDWEHELVVDDVPDMSQPRADLVSDDDAERAMQSLGLVFRLIPVMRREDALRAVMRTLMQFMDEEGASELGRGLRAALPPEGAEGHADADGPDAASFEQGDYDLAARRGVSEGQRLRRTQDTAGEESQDDGTEGPA